MRLNTSLGFWIWLAVVIVWRQLLKIYSLQKLLHSVWDGKLAACLQWYTVYFAGVVAYMVYSIHELFTEYDSLPQDTIDTNLRQIYEMVNNSDLRKDWDSFEDFREPLIIRPWLYYLNLVSQFMGLPIVAIALFHVWKLLAVPGKKLAEEQEGWREVPWKPTNRANWLLLLVAMPTMFSVASMRASCRILAIMTGTAFGKDARRWKRITAVETAMYHSDLELAALFQFSTVYAFARICGSILADRAFFRGENNGETDAVEYTWALNTAGFLCVWAFVVVGMIRTVFSFTIAELEQFETMQETASLVQDKIFMKISTVFSAITILCVINMIIICKMSIITDRLGNATRKFMGTRILLLCAEIQPRLLDVITVGSAMYNTVDAMVKKEGTMLSNFPIHRWNFSSVQSCLFHLSLLNFECLVVVLFNLFTWYHLDMAKSGIFNFKPIVGSEEKRRLSKDEQAMLLDEHHDLAF